MKIVYNETYFGVQWGASTASRGLSMAAFGRARTDDALAYPSELSNYTVFWCKSTRDFPVTCEGQLFHQDVSASSTSLNITVPDKSNYQFAVAANQGDFSSGLSWSSCIVVANGNGSQVKQVEVISVTSYTIDLAWDLPCSSQNGIITAFNIYCCPVDEADAIDDEEPDCLFGILFGWSSLQSWILNFHSFPSSFGQVTRTRSRWHRMSAVTVSTTSSRTPCTRLSCRFRLSLAKGRAATLYWTEQPKAVRNLLSSFLQIYFLFPLFFFFLSFVFFSFFNQLHILLFLPNLLFVSSFYFISTFEQDQVCRWIWTCYRCPISPCLSRGAHLSTRTVHRLTTKSIEIMITHLGLELKIPR